MEFSGNLIAAFGEVPELVNFVQLPVQTGSDRVLSMMKRGHTVLEYKDHVVLFGRLDGVQAAFTPLDEADFEARQAKLRPAVEEEPPAMVSQG